MSHSSIGSTIAARGISTQFCVVRWCSVQDNSVEEPHVNGLVNQRRLNRPIGTTTKFKLPSVAFGTKRESSHRSAQVPASQSFVVEVLRVNNITPNQASPRDVDSRCSLSANRCVLLLVTTGAAILKFVESLLI